MDRIGRMKSLILYIPVNSSFRKGAGGDKPCPYSLSNVSHHSENRPGLARGRDADARPESLRAASAEPSHAFLHNIKLKYVVAGRFRRDDLQRKARRVAGFEVVGHARRAVLFLAGRAV